MFFSNPSSFTLFPPNSLKPSLPFTRPQRWSMATWQMQCLQHWSRHCLDCGNLWRNWRKGLTSSFYSWGFLTVLGTLKNFGEKLAQHPQEERRIRSPKFLGSHLWSKGLQMFQINPNHHVWNLCENFGVYFELCRWIRASNKEHLLSWTRRYSP